MLVRVFGVIVILAAAGCASMQNSVQRIQPPLGELETTATYDILGDTKGSAHGSFLLWFIPLEMDSKIGIAGYESMGYSPVQKAAMYNAIEAVPGADAIIAPRWRFYRKNYLVYCEETVTVKGKAIRYNPSAE